MEQATYHSTEPTMETSVMLVCTFDQFHSKLLLSLLLVTLVMGSVLHIPQMVSLIRRQSISLMKS